MLDRTAAANFARARAASGLLILDVAERVLAVRPTYKQHWDIPGGYVESGETPAEACAREVEEELGICRPVGRLLVVDWAPHPEEGDKILFVFDGTQLPIDDLAAIRPAVDELHEFAFHEFADLVKLMPERLVRRLGAALGARREGITRYLEHGMPL